MESSVYTLKVDPEFQGLIEPLNGDEWDRLEKSLKTEGFREDRGKIITWNEVIVDGHHRYQICHQNNIPFIYTKQDFVDRDAVKLWIIDEQLGRRNLNDYQRASLVLKEKEAIAAEAKKRQGDRTDLKQKDQNFPPKLGESSSPNKHAGETGQVLADKAGVGRETFRKTERLEEEADEETKEQLRRGEKSVTKAYKELRQKTQDTRDLRPSSNGSSTEADPFKSPRVKELVEEKPIVKRILKVKTVEYTVEWRDGTKGSISRQALLKEDFCKCRSCNGYGVLPKSLAKASLAEPPIPQKERKES